MDELLKQHEAAYREYERAGQKLRELRATICSIKPFTICSVCNFNGVDALEALTRVGSTFCDKCDNIHYVKMSPKDIRCMLCNHALCSVCGKVAVFNDPRFHEHDNCMNCSDNRH